MATNKVFLVLKYLLNLSIAVFLPLEIEIEKFPLYCILRPSPQKGDMGKAIQYVL